MSFLDKMKHKAADLAAGNRDKIDSYVDKAATTIDSKTQGKYADTVAKARQGVGKGVDKVAEGSTEAPFPLDPDAPRTPVTDPTDTTAAGTDTDGTQGTTTPPAPHGS